VIERVVENWLTSVNERQYQFPYCQVLLAKGYRVLHLSSHGPQEQGKDIIALDNKGKPVCFQLKTGDIDLAALRAIHGELNELVEVPLQFPGIPRGSRHRSVLVTNGMLNDTARQTLDGYVRGWQARRFPRLQVELKDSLLRDFVDLHGRYLPTQLHDVEKLLRFYTRDGGAPLPRGAFADFVASNMPIGDLSKRANAREPQCRVKQRQPAAKDLERHIASTALLVSYALYPFATKKNHWAEFEGWIVFCAHVLAVAERWDLPDDRWQATFDLAFLAARTALSALIQEACSRDQWLEGDVLVDSPVYRARMTIILGLTALHALICAIRNEQSPLEDQSAAFVDAHRRELHLWGETAVPYLSLLAFYLERRVSIRLGESLFALALSAIVSQNRTQEEGAPDTALSDPYLEIDDAIARTTGARPEPPWDRRHYDGQAYTHRALVMLLTRRLRRQLLSSNWYDISDVSFVEMMPTASWMMLLWRAPQGDLSIRLAGRPQSWATLLEEARGITGDQVPQRLRTRPDFLSAFLTVFPHRFRADTLKIIEDAVADGTAR
jgi:hypothetical protein